jgi:hypothetical protein
VRDLVIVFLIAMAYSCYVHGMNSFVNELNYSSHNASVPRAPLTADSDVDSAEFANSVLGDISKQAPKRNQP